MKPRAKTMRPRAGQAFVKRFDHKQGVLHKSLVGQIAARKPTTLTRSGGFFRFCYMAHVETICTCHSYQVAMHKFDLFNL